MKKFLSTLMAALLAVSLVFTAACVDNANSGDTSYTVTVQSIGGLNLSGVTVTASLDGSSVGSQVTDENGQVTFNLNAAEYTLSVSNLPNGYSQPDIQYTTDTQGSPVTIRVESFIIDGEAPAGLVYEEGDVIYDFTYENLTRDENGNIVRETRTLSQSFEDGREMVMLNFYYTLCGPCATEFPLMNQAYGEYDALVDVIAMCDENGGGDTEAESIAYRYSFETPLSFYMGYDEGGNTIANHFTIPGYPTNVIIDRYGVICMIEAGSISDANTFINWFERYTGDDYIQDVGNDFELEHPDVENPPVEDIANAVNDSSIDGKITYRWEDEDEYTWPWIVGSDNASIQTSNANSAGSYAIIYADITLDENEVLAFDFYTSTEAGADIFYVFIDNEIVYQYSGSSTTPNWQTCYAYVGDGGQHELALAYVKDTGSDVGDDTVYVRNMRTTTETELIQNDITVDILRQAATGYNESTHTYSDYADVVYNSIDGYYHIGSHEGPYLLVEMIEDTQWGPGLYSSAITAVNYVNSGICDENDDEYVLYENYDIIEKYAWYSRYTSYESSLTPVNQELRNALVEVVAALGNDDSTDNETEWLELGRYYQQYGANVEEQTGDPLAGLTIETAIPATMQGQTANMIPKVPRGAFYSFSPSVSGAYEISTSDITITTSGGGSSDTFLWLFDENYGDIFEPTVIDSSEGGSIIAELEAGETYYISVALSDPNLSGTCTLNISYYNEDYIVRPVASNAFVFDEDTGEIYLPTYVDVRLLSDGYYYAFEGDENLGRIFVDFEHATTFSESPLTAWIERTYTNEDGTTTTVNMFDFREGCYYDEYYAEREVAYNEALAAYIENGGTREEFIEANGEFVNVYEQLPEEYKINYTSRMQAFAGMANDLGYVQASEDLVEILQILMDLEDRLTDNAWLQLCYYIEELTVIDPTV